MGLGVEALRVLERTSRTFFIPINRLPSPLLEAVGSAYLCMRAIDEIEDDPALEGSVKSALLRGVHQVYESVSGGIVPAAFASRLRPYQGVLPEVTLRIDEWSRLAPTSIAPRIFDAIAAMASRMADWTATNWRVQTEVDLDRYTFGVAGSVGLLLSDLWSWYDGTRTDRFQAVGFGRGLQAVNMLRNRRDDLARGVSFFPTGWTQVEMAAYARRNLALADAYVESLPEGPARAFCSIPRVVAYATLEVLARGREKLDRRDVQRLVATVSGTANQ